MPNNRIGESLQDYIVTKKGNSYALRFKHNRRCLAHFRTFLPYLHFEDGRISQVIEPGDRAIRTSDEFSSFFSEYYDGNVRPRDYLIYKRSKKANRQPLMPNTDQIKNAVRRLTMPKVSGNIGKVVVDWDWYDFYSKNKNA